MQGYREIHKDKTLLCLALSPSLCFILSLSSLSPCFFPSLRAITVEVFNTHTHTHTHTITRLHIYVHHHTLTYTHYSIKTDRGKDISPLQTSTLVPFFLLHTLILEV